MTVDPFALNWRHLRAVHAVVKHGSMGRAADAVNLSQPALTQGIAKLEAQLGAKLFERRHDGMRATADGTILAERVEAARVELAVACRAVGRGAGRGISRAETLLTATQLHAFLHVVDAGGFAAAVAATALSQPALHRAVRDLEEAVGAVLLDRRGRGMLVTAEGYRLARGVRVARSEIEAALAEIGAPTGRRGRLGIGAMPLCRARLLPAAIAALSSKRPDMQVQVIEGSWRELVGPLRDGSIDLMIGALREQGVAGLEQQPLFLDRISVIGRAGHPLDRPVPPTRDELARYPWLVGPAGAPLREHWDTLFADLDPRPDAPIECGSVMVARGVLAASDFLTLLSRDQVALEVERGMLATIGPPLHGAVRTIGVTRRAGWRPTPGQSSFLRLLEEASASLHKSE